MIMKKLLLILIGCISLLLSSCTDSIEVTTPEYYSEYTIRYVPYYRPYYRPYYIPYYRPLPPPPPPVVRPRPHFGGPVGGHRPGGMRPGNPNSRPISPGRTPSRR